MFYLCRMRKLKKLLSIFFLLAFVIPTFEKGIHAFEHEDDFHCVSSEFHFHSVEHHCQLCEFTNDVTSSSPSDESRELSFICSEIQNQSLSFLLPKHFVVFASLRAPPAFVNA